MSAPTKPPMIAEIKTQDEPGTEHMIPRQTPRPHRTSSSASRRHTSSPKWKPLPEVAIRWTWAFERFCRAAKMPVELPMKSGNQNRERGHRGTRMADDAGGGWSTRDIQANSWPHLGRQRRQNRETGGAVCCGQSNGPGTQRDDRSSTEAHCRAGKTTRRRGDWRPTTSKQRHDQRRA